MTDPLVFRHDLPLTIGSSMSFTVLLSAYPFRFLDNSRLSMDISAISRQEKQIKGWTEELCLKFAFQKKRKHASNDT